MGGWGGGEFLHHQQAFLRHKKDSIRFHRLRIKVYKTAPPSGTPSGIPTSNSSGKCFGLTGYKSEVPRINQTSLDLINLLEGLTELRKQVDSLDYPFITKDINQ